MTLDYATLDAIADAYIPALAVAFIGIFVARTLTKQLAWRESIRVFLFGAILLSSAYALMFADNYYHLWPRVNLDYSTHTAVALALAFALGVLWKRYWWVWVITSMAYFLLMLYQRYHTPLDIATTAVSIALIAYITYRKLLTRADH
jgi:hypothetical protein